jgi:hypothetical protein
MDEMTRYTEAYPLRTHDAESVAKVFMDQFMTRYGVPREILTDRGAEFVGEVFTIMCKNLRMKKLHTCAYRPQGNGANERVHQTLYTLLRNLCRNHPSRWRHYLPYALYAYHTQHHRSIGMTPQEALYGYTARVIPYDDNSLPPATSLGERIQMLQCVRGQASSTSGKELEAQRKLAKTRPSPVYDVGDQVKIAHRMKHKMDAKWRGPYTIVRRVSNTAYEVQLDPGERIHHLVHHAHLRPWYATEEDDEVDDANDGDDTNYDVEMEDPESADDEQRMEDPAVLQTEDPSPIGDEDPRTLQNEDPSHIGTGDPRPTSTGTQPAVDDADMRSHRVPREGRMPPMTTTCRRITPSSLHPIEEEAESSDDTTKTRKRGKPKVLVERVTRIGRSTHVPTRYRD